MMGSGMMRWTRNGSLICDDVVALLLVVVVQILPIGYGSTTQIRWLRVVWLISLNAYMYIISL